MSSFEFTLNVVLNCVPTDSSVEKQLLFDHKAFPATVLDVKAQIQSSYEIPVCCQTLYHGAERLRNDEDLKSHRIRDGETVKVSYSSEADVQQVLGAMPIMSSMVSYITEIQPILSKQEVETEAATELNAQLPLHVKYHVLEDIIECFGERVSDRADANRLLFIDNGGLNYICQLHDLLLKQPLHNTPLPMQLLEDSIVSMFWILSCSSVTSRLLIKPSIIKAIGQSFLRAKINNMGDIELSPNRFADIQQGSGPTQKRVAFKIVFRAMGALCNIAENPDSRMQIACKQEVLDQMVALPSVPFSIFAIRLFPVATLLYLAYSSNTHVHLATPSIMHKMLQACAASTLNLSLVQEQETLLLQYNCIMFFALLVTSSAQLIPLGFKQKIFDFIDEFLKTATPAGIHHCSKENDHTWSTVTPYMVPAYYPYLNPERSCTATSLPLSNNEVMRKLELHCVEMGVFSMQTAVLDSEAMAVILKEGLLDYIICLPWNLPQRSRAKERAHELNAFLSKQLQLQPPPLLTMAKAKLAAMHFGLDRFLKVNSVHELLAEVLPA